ncbi:hypothetical protein QBB34_22940 [Streptomyces stelliscabiei]|uniref:hypothetical protein n=1 Tax=Streptomyces stelliscabiei TaxID=146820 RepID=UPI002FF0BA7B
MSEDRPVVSAEIPEFTGNLEQLETDAGDIAFDGMAVGAAGLLIDANFNLLEPFYKAPEADQLFATTAPVAAAGHDLQTELSTVSKALLDYAAEVRPLVDRLNSLREEAAAFERRVADDDWVADGDLIEENTSRRSAVNAAWAAFQAAELACHNKIVALVGGEPLVVGDGSNKKNMYGYRAEDLDHAGGLPWGDVVEESNPWYYFHEHAWDFTVGFFVDGVWGTIRGLGTLVGVDGWDAAGQAWTGLGKLLTGIVITAVPVVGAAYWLAPDDKLPSWLRDSRTAVVETGKALIAYDEWGKNPSRAAGAVTFNVLTTVFTGGAGGAVAGTGKAGAIAKAISFAGRAGRIVDPMTYLAKGVGGAAVRISDVMAGLRGITNGTHIRLGEGTYRIADVPNITDDLPAGLTPENSVRMTTPEGQVVYLDTKTLVMHNADGTVRESLDGIRHEATAEQRAGDGVRQEGAGAGRGEREVVGAGARAHVGDSAGVGGRGGDDVVGTGGRAGEEPPVGRGGSGGRAGGGMDDLGHGGDDAVGNGPDHGTGAGGGAGTGAAGGARPDFMREGGDPYGPRGSLTREQIEEIQVYRANNEPGYREHYYRKDGTRKSLELYDESGQTPPQLTRVSENSPWVRAKDVPAPPKPHFLDDKYIGVGADTVSSRARLRLLEESARTRHLAIQWDNLMSEWKAETGRAHEIRQTHESAGLWGEAKGSYKESHTAMGGAAEALGENAARHHYIAERYPDFTDEPLLGPKSGNDQFDQVWTHEDGRVVVIEAKSSPGTDFGRRTLPNGKQVSQGSREYFYDILEAMKSRGEFDVVEAIERAIEDNKFEYTVVKGEKNAGTYTGYQYRRFDISKGTLP